MSIQNSLIRFSLFSGALLLGQEVVWAQQEPEAASRVSEEVVVTGSRIPRDTFSTAAPVAVLDAAEIEAVGTTNIGEFLQRIPQTVAAFNSSNNVFASGSSGLQLTALRNLGTARTLTLVNGRRFVSGITPSVGYAVDLNAIPSALIERVEIKTGGTSAIYGSDAIAGVVNIILKDDFEGLDLRLQTNQPGAGDRQRYNMDVTMGLSFERGHAWAAVGYSEDRGLSALDRDFSDTDLAYYTRAHLDTLGFSERSPGNYWLGSSFLPSGRFGNFKGDGTPYVSGLADRENSDRFNRASYRDLSSPTDRAYAAAGVEYELTDGVKAHILINYNQTQIDTTYEPFPLDLVSDIWDIPKGGTGGLDVATSPLVPALLRTNLLAAGIMNLNELSAGNTPRRLVEFAGRGSDIDRRTFRIEGGVSYELANGWVADVWGTYGETRADQQNNSGINGERAALALDVEIDPLDQTTLRCVDAEARRRGCAPFNVFGEGTISDEAVEYLALNTQTDQQVGQSILGATLVGDAWFIPTLPGGAVGFAVGVEYREETGSSTPDAAVQAGVTTSNRIAATDGSYDVLEGFIEVSVPVLEQLTISAALRVGDYSTVGAQTNWSLGFEAPITNWVRFRGSISDAVRAPNISNLFRGAGETFASATDVCDGVVAADTGNAAVNCRSVPAIQQRIDDTGAFTLTQVEKQSTGGFNGGNPDAQEETAFSYTVGAVLTPDVLLPGLQFAIDFYQIEIEGVLAFPLRADVVTNCYSVDPSVFDPTCPGPVPSGVQTLRDPSTGALLEVNRSFLNQEDWLVRGIDLEVDYSRELGPGTLGINALLTYLNKYTITDLVTGNENEEAGEVEFPDYRLYGGINYALDQWRFSWTVSLLAETVDANTDNENGAVSGELDKAGNTCDITSYHDVRATWRPQEKFTVFGGVRNLFDQQPCELTQLHKHGHNGLNTNGTMYDVTGRDFYLGLQVRL